MRSLRDPNKPLPSEPRQTEQVIQDVMHPRLIERLVIHEDGDFHSRNSEGGWDLLDGGTEESKEEGVEDPEVGFETAAHPGFSCASSSEVFRLETVEHHEHRSAQYHSRQLSVVCISKSVRD